MAINIAADRDTEKVSEPASSPVAPPPDEYATEEAGDVTEKQIVYLTGFRLKLIAAALSMCLFLVNLEIPIVTTSLVAITDDLHSYDQISWIISAYLLGYVGILIIFAKLSDIFGRKLLLSIAIAIFVIFSGACGAAQTTTQLIVFRAFQGIGGGGSFSLCTVILIELVPEERYAAVTSSVSIVYGISLLLGPILGGAISKSSTWRWVFLLNVPAGVLAGIIVVFYLPTGFPFHGQKGLKSRNARTSTSKSTLGRVDILGTIVLLGATLLLVAAFEEAGNKYPWKSPFVITLLTISGILWICFLTWERRVTLAAKGIEPVFPWRFVQSRVWIGMLLNAIFLGGPWFVSIFQLPQRFQIVYGASPLGAGIRLMPFTFAAPVGSAVSALIAGKLKVPPIYLVMCASVLQVIGFVLLSTLSYTPKVTAAHYGYEVIAGFGCGINISLLILMTPFSIEKRDQAVALGSVTQFRVMGGVIGLAIVTTVQNSFVRSRLSRSLSPNQIDQFLQSPGAAALFSPEIQLAIKKVLSDGFNIQMKILAGFAAAQIPSSLMMWQKKQIVV